MNKIQTLISQNKIREAIQEMKSLSDDKYFQNDLLMQEAALSRLEKDSILSILTYEEEKRSRAKIVHALLTLTENLGFKIEEQPQDVNMENSKTSYLKNLLNTYTRYKSIEGSKEAALYKETKELLQDITEYEVKIAEKPLDASPRIERAFDLRFEKLKAQENNLKEDRTESFKDQIASILSDEIPSWEALEKAYKLCMSKGMRNTQVETDLANKIDDLMIQANTAITIESWAANNSK